MKIKDVKLGTSYHFQLGRWKEEGRLWVLSRDLYEYNANADLKVQRFKATNPEFVRRPSKNGFGTAYGYPSIQIDKRAVKNLTPELIEMLDEVTMEQVLGHNGLPPQVTKALAEADVHARVRAIDSRRIDRQWDEYVAAKEADKRYQAEWAERERKERADIDHRMGEVVRVLNILLDDGTDQEPNWWRNQAPYALNPYGSRNDKLTMDLEDLEKVADVLKVALPHVFKEQ